MLTNGDNKMYKVSEIISIPVISIFESELQGIVFNMLFDSRSKKCRFACILNEEESIEKSLDIIDIYQIGKDCIFVKNRTALELLSNHDCQHSEYIPLLNNQVYGLDGKLLGTVSDIELDDKFIIKNLILNNNTKITNKDIINIGKTIIITDNKSININKFKPRLKICDNQQNLNKKDIVLLKNIDEKIPQNEVVAKPTNNKITTNETFLKGRILTKDILTINGELIAKNQSIITSETISKASMYGRLIELARYSKKN